MQRADVTTVILAGGRATRLPGKLERTVDGEPLLARVYHHLRSATPVVISAAGCFSPQLDAALECPVVVDRWPNRGPLAGLLSAMHEVTTPLVFAVAGDSPRVTTDVLDSLLAAREPQDEAVVPEHNGHLEPLAALYSVAAVEREAPAVIHESNASMRAFLERVRVRNVPMPVHFFINVNTEADIPT